MDKAFTEHSFQTFLREEKLMASRCEACGELFVPPRPLCPSCHGEEMEWVELSGKGTLAAFTAVHIGPSAMIAAGYDRNNPYLTGVVELAEGPLISGQILGLDAAQPDVNDIGTPLTVTFITRGAGDEARTFLAFTA
jgi:uncharacterized OB-fold protein